MERGYNMSNDCESFVELTYIDPKGTSQQLRFFYVQQLDRWGIVADYYDREIGCWVPYAAVTKILPESTVLRASEAFVDTNNVPHLIAWLEREGFIKVTDAFAVGGFCRYPVALFSDFFLHGICAKQ